MSPVIFTPGLAKALKHKKSEKKAHPAKHKTPSAKPKQPAASHAAPAHGKRHR